MKINLIEPWGRWVNTKNKISPVLIRSKLAEIIAVKVLRAIQTSKYPPKVLTTEFFEDMKSEEKVFLESHWTTFDLFKPLFKIVNEIPVYDSFVLYEVKSKVITEKNKTEMNFPEFRFSFGQKKFFEACTEKHIPIDIFAVFFLDNWEIEIKRFSYSSVKKVFTKNSVWHEEKMKRIKSSKLNQFFNELYPEYVLYKIDEGEMERKEVLSSEEYITEMLKEPDEYQKRLIKERGELRSLHRVTGCRKITTISRRGPRTIINRKSNRFGDVSKRYGQGIAFDEVRKNYPSAYEKWTIDEDAKLKKEFFEGVSIDDMAKVHSRQPGGIKSRLKKLKLIE